jgi:hypothetical protein
MVAQLSLPEGGSCSTIFSSMTSSASLRCDGCGRLADSDHIARRLRRLEWATRFRPIHIQTLLLAGVSPERDDEFLYSPEGAFEGEARNILRAVQVSTEGKSREAVLVEFQKLGLMLAHVLECPLADAVSSEEAHTAIQAQLPSVMARIRRSLKPKRVFLLSAELHGLTESLRGAELGCPIFPTKDGTFLASNELEETQLRVFREALAAGHG